MSRKDAESLISSTLLLPVDQRDSFIAEACGADTALAATIRDEVSRQTIDQQLTETDVRPDDLIGPYQIKHLIAEGGMGAVYLAEQTAPVTRSVALKVIKLGLDTRSVLSRFHRERQALAAMNHPNVANVLDAGATDTGRPYFAMEYIDGGDLVRYCDDHRLNLRDRVLLVRQVCAGLQHAHQKGVIHRDVKPSNVMVTVTDGKPLIKIIDFGIARVTSSDGGLTMTEPGVFVGTPNYVSPEQAGLGEADIDTRTDVYSTGVLLYQLLTGVLPFDSDTFRRKSPTQIQEIIRTKTPKHPDRRVRELGAELSKVASQRRIAPYQLRRELHGDLGRIIMKSITKERDRRYGSVSDLSDDLGRYLNHEPIQARAPGRWYLLRMFVRRHRAGVALSALGLAVTTSIIGLIFYGLVRLNSQSRSAQESLDEMIALVAAAADSVVGAADPTITQRMIELLQEQLTTPGSGTDDQDGKPDAVATSELHHVLTRLLISQQEFQLAADHALKSVETGKGDGIRRQQESRLGAYLELLRLTGRIDEARDWGRFYPTRVVPRAMTEALSGVSREAVLLLNDDLSIGVDTALREMNDSFDQREAFEWALRVAYPSALEFRRSFSERVDVSRELLPTPMANHAVLDLMAQAAEVCSDTLLQWHEPLQRLTDPEREVLRRQLPEIAAGCPPHHIGWQDRRRAALHALVSSVFGPSHWFSAVTGLEYSRQMLWHGSRTTVELANVIESADAGGIVASRIFGAHSPPAIQATLLSARARFLKRDYADALHILDEAVADAAVPDWARLQLMGMRLAFGARLVGGESSISAFGDLVGEARIKAAGVAPPDFWQDLHRALQVRYLWSRLEAGQVPEVDDELHHHRYFPARMLIWLEAGDPAAAVSEFRSSSELPGAHTMRVDEAPNGDALYASFGGPQDRLYLVEALLELGELELAQTAWAAAQRYALQHPWVPWLGPYSDAVQGVLLAANGDRQRAEELLTEATLILRQQLPLGSFVHSRRAHRYFHQLLLAQGRQTEADMLSAIIRDMYPNKWPG